MKTFLLLWVLLQSAFAAPVLSINQNELWRAMMKQWLVIKFTSPNVGHQKIEMESPALRVDLSIQDLIDQVSEILEKDFKDTNYSKILFESDPIANFDRWYDQLNDLATKDERLKRELDHRLVLQQYNSNGAALTDGIGMLRFARLRKIEKYNRMALDPEAETILAFLSNGSAITVTKAAHLSMKTIKAVRHEQYRVHNDDLEKIEAIEREKYSGRPHTSFEEQNAKMIFKAIEGLAEKHQLIEAIDKEMNVKLARDSHGQPMITYSYILEHEEKLLPILKDLTWRKLLSREDDETLYEFRKWLKRHRKGKADSVKETLENYNATHATKYELNWLSHRGMPRRHEVFETYEILRKIYLGTEPWQKEIHQVLVNRRGNEVVLDHNLVGRIIHKTGHFLRDLVKYENLSGYVAAGGTFVLTTGNLGLALTANSVVHDVVANRKYDHRARELLTEIPLDLMSGALTQTGMIPGRVFNVIAYGAGSGLLQGVLTKQDPLKSAAVGASLELLLQALPSNVREPLVSGVSNGVLAQNAAIEVFTSTAKTTLRGGIVAVLEKQDVVDGMKKGAIYGASTAVLRMVVLGVRYDPLNGYSDGEIQKSIDDENFYDNTHGAPGGNYQITQKTIRDTPYRVNGLLPEHIIDASITLPGSVSMSTWHSLNLDVVVHEAHHLSQQEQLGLARFYIQYVLEGLTVPYESIRFEISPH